MKAKGIVGALLVVPALTMSLMFASGGGGKDGEDEKKADGTIPVNVPAEYQADVSRAGKICPEISAAVIAVQIGKESSWQPQEPGRSPGTRTVHARHLEDRGQGRRRRRGRRPYERPRRDLLPGTLHVLPGRPDEEAHRRRQGQG